MRKLAALLLRFRARRHRRRLRRRGRRERRRHDRHELRRPRPRAPRTSWTSSTPGTLTIAMGNPTYPPWFEQAARRARPGRAATRTTARASRAAFGYALAEQLGFTKDEVEWIPVAFNPSIAPGPKDYDLNIQQVSYSPERAKAVALSDSYFEVNQSVVGLEGTPIANAKTFADLEQYKLGAQVGTTSYQYIVDEIQPEQDPQVYDDLNARDHGARERPDRRPRHGLPGRLLHRQRPAPERRRSSAACRRSAPRSTSRSRSRRTTRSSTA